MRTVKQFPLTDLESFKYKALSWSQDYEDIAYFDSNQHKDCYSTFDLLIAVDAFTSIKTDYDDGFSKLKGYNDATQDWIFGYLSYDLKNDIEDLSSHNKDSLGFPDLFFFQPKKIIYIQDDTLFFSYLKMVDEEIEEDYKDIVTRETTGNTSTSKCDKIKISLSITKDIYKDKVNRMLSHIQRGDIYEANFCQEFYAENSCIDPLLTYKHLNQISESPFSVFFKRNDNFVLSASPERYLKKIGTKIISQPIKGTAKRSKSINEDQELKANLKKEPKERSENIMIVDLVRNDLSKVALRGSVKVEELCEVYSFKQVHQMISTITAEVGRNFNPIDVIKNTFPMGSMTGAPKVSAMRIIEELEETKRGIYSGAIGFITPDGDFDFNVVIRTILYNSTHQYVSYTVGGAITAKSDPDSEYEECLIKAKAMREALERQ